MSRARTLSSTLDGMSTSLDSMTLDEGILPQVEAAHGRLLDSEHEVDRARVDFHHELRRLYAAGGSLREIAERFGLSHQRVHQIVDVSGDARRKRAAGKGTDLVERIKGRVRDWGGFARFTADARAVVRRAQEEAGRLGHGQVGTEHVLLGLLSGSDDEPAVRALRAMGVEFASVRTEVLHHVGTGDARADAASLRFTPRAKKVLERSLREALALKDEHIGPEHILLGLLHESSGLAARVLHDLGVAPGRLRAEVARLRQGVCTPGAPTGSTPGGSGGSGCSASRAGGRRSKPAAR